MASATIKRGDTFTPGVTVSINGMPQNITGWGIQSQIRDKVDNLVATLSVTNRNDSAGTYTLATTGAYPESGWKVGEHLWDIQYTDPNGVVFSTETITLSVVKDITR